MSKQKFKALKYTISGTYKTADKITIDYENVTGIIPFCENEKVALKHLRNRYALRWVKDATTSDSDYSKRDRVNKLHEIYVDDVEVTESEFSFVGKDIRKMSFEELQDLSTSKDLNNVPVKRGSTRRQREIAYREYAKSIGMDIKKDADISKLPELKAEDAFSVTSKAKPRKNIEEIIQEEVLGSDDTVPAENKQKKVENPFLK